MLVEQLSVASIIHGIIQDVLTTVVQCSDSRALSLLLECRPDAVVVVIDDDGYISNGKLSVDGVAEPRWLDLVKLREHITELGGTLSARPAFGRGSRILIRVPIETAGV